jgi:L-threonylcarbamoyladenylate synthase
MAKKVNVANLKKSEIGFATHHFFRVRHAVKVLKSGGVVALPTETVWGLAAYANNPAAIKTLYEIKGREEKKPFVMAYPAPHAVTQNPKATKLLNKGITVVLENNIAVRIPQNALCKKILKKIHPLALTSANISGQTPLTTHKAIKKTFPNIAVIAARPPKGKAPSTIVRLTGDGEVEILRKGAQEDIY